MVVGVLFAKTIGSSGFPYGMLDLSAPGLNPCAVFDDGKRGSQTAQKYLPWGVGYGEDKKVETACTRAKHGPVTKLLFWREQNSSQRKNSWGRCPHLLGTQIPRSTFPGHLTLTALIWEGPMQGVP